MHELLILWWSRTGASEQLSIAAEAGASISDQVQVRRLRCDHAEPGDLQRAAAYVFVCPENLGSMAGMMKECFDRCYYPLLGALEGRPYGCIVSAGSDGQGAVRQITRIATGWRLKPVSAPIIVNLSAQTAEEILAVKVVDDSELRRATELGALIAHGAALGIF